MNINRQLLKRYFNVSCKRVMLNEYLDDGMDDKECETNEEIYKDCSVEKSKSNDD